MSHSTHAGFRVIGGVGSPLGEADGASELGKAPLGVPPLQKWRSSPRPPRSASEARGVGNDRIVTTVSRFGKRSPAFSMAASVIPAAIAEQLRGVGHCCLAAT